MRITRAIDFSSSLRYWREDLSPEENEVLFGPAVRHHGHNYRLEVTLRGVPDPRTGMLMDLKQVKEILEREIMARFDHRDLNGDTPYFKECVPTPENFARVIFDLLKGAFPDDILDRVRLIQDPDLWVDVWAGEGASR